MRQFAAPSFRLWNLSREAKVIYTFFCALSLCAIASSLLLYEDLVGPTLGKSHLFRVRAYYAGSRETAASAPDRPSEPASGPAIVLPAEAEPASEPGGPPDRLTVAVPYRKLLEITHFHLFTVPVFLLILTHIFMLTALSPRWKLFWIAAGWGTGTLHIFAPWLVRFGGARLATTFPLSGTGFLVTSLVLCLYPLFVMWQKPRGARSASAAA